MWCGFPGMAHAMDERFEYGVVGQMMPHCLEMLSLMSDGVAVLALLRGFSWMAPRRRISAGE